MTVPCVEAALFQHVGPPHSVPYFISDELIGGGGHNRLQQDYRGLMEVGRRRRGGTICGGGNWSSDYREIWRRGYPFFFGAGLSSDRGDAAELLLVALAWNCYFSSGCHRRGGSFG